MTKHTPTPLSLPIFKEDVYDIHMYSHTVIYDDDKYEIARMNDPDFAAFIVRACNAHDDLIAALHAMMEYLEELEESGYGRCEDNKSYMISLAALAKAKGTP